MSNTNLPLWKSLAIAGLAGVVLTVAIRAAMGGDDRRMDGWYSYDYRAGLDVEPAVNVFHRAVEHDGAVWVNHRQWSIDDPEAPPSVLALVRYDEWDLSQGVVATTRTAGDDLTDTAVCFDLQGRNLDLHGAEVTFWVMSAATGQRWHHRVPLDVGDEWTAQRVITSGEWRNSWRWDRRYRPDLAGTLRYATSYGIGFVGFDEEQKPTGLLGMRGFRVGC